MAFIFTFFRAIRESLRDQVSGKETPTNNEGEQVRRRTNSLNEEEQLRLVMELSEQEDKEAELRRKQEEEELEKILALSLTDK